MQEIFRIFFLHCEKGTCIKLLGPVEMNGIILCANILKSFIGQKQELLYENPITCSFFFLIRWWVEKGAEGEVERIIEIKFMKTITVFFLLCRAGSYLISKILGAVLVRGRPVIEGSAYFKVKKTKQIKKEVKF